MGREASKGPRARNPLKWSHRASEQGCREQRDRRPMEGWDGSRHPSTFQPQRRPVGGLCWPVEGKRERGLVPTGPGCLPAQGLSLSHSQAPPRGHTRAPGEMCSGWTGCPPPQAAGPPGGPPSETTMCWVCSTQRERQTCARNQKKRWPLGGARSRQALSHGHLPLGTRKWPHSVVGLGQACSLVGLCSLHVSVTSQP